MSNSYSNNSSNNNEYDNSDENTTNLQPNPYADYADKRYPQKQYEDETEDDTEDDTENGNTEDETYENIVTVDSRDYDRLKYAENKRYKNIVEPSIEISYIKKGTGPFIILVPGYSMTQDMWPPEFINILAQQYTVVTYDLRGVGSSKDDGAEHSLELYADDLLRLIKHLRIQRATIMGWSMGANICQEFALNYSNQLYKLILYAGDAGPNTGIKVSRKAVSNLLNTYGTYSERETRYFKLIFPEKWLNQHMSKIRDYIPRSKISVSPEVIWKQWNAIYSWDGSLDRLHKISCPTLILVGEQDELPNSLNSNLLAEHIHNTWFIKYPGAGNGLIYQYPGKVATTITCFLKSS
jgi:pimeloyl-ACP methyl ester carboxylesterase